jgi:hypothetical protein
MEVKNETIYVIYHNGTPYPHVQKPVYLTKGSAKGQITHIAKKLARERFENVDYGHNYWYVLDNTGREDLIEEARNEFKIIEYKPSE